MEHGFRIESRPNRISRVGNDGKTAFRVRLKDVTHYLDEQGKKEYASEEKHTDMEESTVECYECLKVSVYLQICRPSP